MTRPKKRIPQYRHYKPKDLGVVRIYGRDHYLGKYDSPARWEAAGSGVSVVDFAFTSEEFVFVR